MRDFRYPWRHSRSEEDGDGSGLCQPGSLVARARAVTVLIRILLADDGLEATRKIVADARLDSVRVVILTNFGLDEYIFRALRAGASGFLLKDTQPAELLQALQVAMRGDALLSPWSSVPPPPRPTSAGR